MNNLASSEELRKVAMNFDEALENKNLNAILERFSDDCEIELIGIKLSGKGAQESG
jgi:hypothetical protein